MDILDDVPLFSVNPGVPIRDALERAAVVQILSEMSRALVLACKGEGAAVTQANV